jgi:PilZ domain-containing protein
VRCKQDAGFFPCPFGQLSRKTRELSARLTDSEALTDHGCAMSPVVYERERRSSRVFMRIRVLLAGKNQQGRRFRHACETIVINAHGALLYFDQDLEIGSLLVLTNPFTQDEQECRVVYLGDESDKGRRVGVEFVTPAPRFWGVELTDSDWVSAQRESFPKN